MGCEPAAVLPTRGNTELFQPQRFRQGQLWEGLLGEHRGDSVWSLVTLRRVQENKFLDLAQFFQ